ncbi:lethal(3)malignant brain tumor-like protein 3 [Nephila pilipes]|uniref:Lethal(3)malignant brain tumor-like protein 1 n=1 Tax=Nephila pilipes TaxID=299642 RepID=A0A8X6NAJ2_NEPPI|nr:lethal(3)malignant brain tumor-like protein 3 [Nephila pilipes]
MALAAPSSSVASTSASCLSPQLPLISLRETVAKINMPAVVQSPAINPQISLSTTTVSNEPLYNLTISNGEIINSASTSTVPKIAVPSVTALAVPRDFKTDPVTTTSQKPIIVTVSGMSGMTAGKHMTSATNVLTAPILSAPVHIVPQHFTADKLPTMSRVTANINPVLSAKPRQTPHITPILPGSLLTSKGQLVIASANSPMIGSSTGSVITTMSSISLSSSIVTVTPVIMTSTAPLVTLSGNLNQVTQAQLLSSIISSTVKPALTTNNKTIVPTAYLKPVNIAANPASFPVAVQPATIAPAAITLATPPMQQQQQQPVSQMTAAVPQLQPSKDPEIEVKTDPKTADFDPIKAMVWKDGIGELPGSDLKFRVTEFGTLELTVNEDVPNVPSARAVKDESTATLEDGSTESRQKATKIKEMYQDENSIEKISQNGAKDPNMSEELCRCENCDCFGLKIEFCKSGRFCSQSCVSSYANKRNTWLKRGAASKEKIKRKKLKIEQTEENGTKNEVEEVKNEEMESVELPEMKKDERIPEPKKKDFRWEEYLKQENAIAAPVKLFKEFQTYPSNGNGFVKDMKLEGIDQKHPSLFCVLTVSETKGYRVRLHFDGYSECFDFWVNADSPDIFPVGWCEKTGHQLQPPKGFTIQEFDWNSYLKASQAEAAPKQLFTWKSQPANPYFRRGMKLEAVDKKNSSLVCVATITDVMDNRFLIHFDGWEDVYDYWADASSPHLHPVNWCKDNNRVLTPPKDTKENVTFSWTKYLADTRSAVVPLRAFKPCPPNEFKVGMKLEAVDKRNPGLIRVATIADKTDHNLLIHFDGWPSSVDYWVDDNSPDIHPINWCAKTGHPLEPPAILTVKTGLCPTPGCLGQGHIKGPKFTSHHSAFGCPYSQPNLNKIDTVGQERVIITKESLNEFTKKISDQGGATDGLRRCPTPGCNGVGHVKGKYSVHHRISGCPLAERNALKIQQSSSTTSNPSTSRTPTPPPSVASTSSSNADIKNLENMKTRNGVGRGKKKYKVAGTGLRGRPPKHLTALRMEAIKKAQEASEKKTDLEEKIHESVFNAPFVTPPKELPLSWEHNTQLIPGLSSIKGSAARQWSVNQVAKFVSSLKGCTDHGKIFREQLIDGEALLEMTQADLLDILHLKLGPALKVYSSIIAFKESEKFE